MAVPIRVIVTDIDGTLLDCHHLVRPSTESAYISIAHNDDLVIVPCTGRSRSSALCAVRDAIRRSIVGDEGKVKKEKELEKEKEIEKAVDARLDAMGFRTYPAVFMNGLIAYGPNGPEDVVFEKCLDRGVASTLIKYTRSLGHPGVHFFVNIGDWIYIDDTTGEAERFLLKWKEGNPIYVNDLVEFIEGGARPNKVTALCYDCDVMQGRVRPAVWKFLEEEDIEVVLTCALPEELDIMPPGASKAEGLSYVLKALDASVEETLAIGDGENDAELMEYVAMSVAMGNGVEKTKAAAKWIAPHNHEDGWAEAMKRFVLKMPRETNN